MRAFAALLDGLAFAQSPNRKMALLARYFHNTPDPDRGWGLAALTDGIPARLALRRFLVERASRSIDPLLYKLSRDYVGDTAETIALLWPQGDSEQDDLRLHTVISAMNAATPSLQAQMLGQCLDGLDTCGRRALLKLLGGRLRVGVTASLVRTCLGESFDKGVADIDGLWHALNPPYEDLFAWLEGQADKPDTQGKAVFHPVMLAHSIGEADWVKMTAGDVAAEWKWDGIRVQIAARGGDVRMFSRRGDDLARAFPEIRSSFLTLDCVVDGELLVMRAGEIARFGDLQQRLNRQRVSARLLKANPAHVRLYDLLFDGQEDLRSHTFVVRRQRLEDWHSKHRPPLTDLSALIPFQSFVDLKTLWSAVGRAGVEGLMLKRKLGPYRAGRADGEWFKWKRAAQTLDCVLMYAQRGSGQRSSLYCDYTFGVWCSGEGGKLELVPVGKACAAFSAMDLQQLDVWIRGHTRERFGPICAVQPGIVLEVACDDVQPSTRHKSGVAMRFPRIHRIRWDKPAPEADTLKTVLGLIPRTQPR
jgi:DNA ligase 1